MKNRIVLVAAIVGLTAWAYLSCPVARGAETDASLTFYLPFEQNASAIIAGGNSNLLAGSIPGVLTNGIKGQGMLLDQKTLLRYAIPGNYRNARGSLVLWVKFLMVEGSECYLFYEEGGPTTSGSQILRIFTVSDRLRIYYNFFDEHGHWTVTPFPLDDAMGEWHQIALTWDKDIGDRFYIDGRFCNHIGGPCGALVHNFQRGTKDYEKMTIGLRQTKASIVLDEVEIYNRMLTDEEVQANYAALFPLKMSVSPIYFNQGKAGAAELALVNTRTSEVKGDLTWRITDAGGMVVSEDRKLSIVVRPGTPEKIAIPFLPGKEGQYRLVYTFSGLTTMVRGVNLYAVPADEQTAGKEVKPKLKLELVKTFDCALSYGTNEYCDDGLSQVVTNAAGVYRETGNKPWSRFAYHFRIDRPKTPYLAVVEYPDDKERVMEIMIDNKTNRHHQTIENGLITGGEFPNSNRFQEYRLLFFPADEDCALQVMTWPKGDERWVSHAYRSIISPAACRSIKIYKVLGGLPEVDFKNLPPPDKQRLVGYEEEDCTPARYFGVNTVTHRSDFNQTYLAHKRWADYMSFVGQNVYAYPLIRYLGSMYPSEATSRGVGDMEDHPDYWVDLALDLFHKRGIKFIGDICFWVNPELAKIACLGPDQEGVARGEDSVLQVAWNGELGLGSEVSNDVSYDILHPRVLKAYLDIVDEILAKYGGHPAFAGLSFWSTPEYGPWFASLKWGYSDRDIALFEKETGIKVPEVKDQKSEVSGQISEVGGKDPKRFLKRYMFLTKKDDATREQWVAWRCAKVREFWMKIYEHVQAKNPNLKLTVETWAPFPGGGIYSIKENVNPEDVNSVYDFWRRGGFDLKLYKDIPNFYIGKVFYNNLRYPDENQEGQDFNFDPGSILPFQNKGANAMWLEQHRREFDNMQWAAPLPGYWWKEYACEKSGAVMPAGDFYLELYANTLANFDARLITDGGITGTTLGHEDDLREFIRAYRTLPAEDFALFGGVDDPLCVRHRLREDGYYFYLVNREFYPVEAALTFTADGKFKLLDLAADTEMKGKQGQPVKVMVGPFRVLAFKAPKDVKLSVVTVAIPEGNLKWLEEQVKAFRASVAELENRKITLDEESQGQIKWVTPEIEKAWAGKQYSRLRHLLNSFRARKMRRILEDKQLQAYLAVPQKYADDFYKPLEIKVRKTASVPGMDSGEWGTNVVTDVFSEVKMIEGKYRPKPLEEKTMVSALYDNEKIGFLFRCYDKEIGKMIAKKVERDGSVIAPDDDSVEVFITHYPGNKPYFHFMANYGRSFKDRKAPEREEWYNPDWTIETRKLDDSWLALMTIPFKALEKNPQPGDVWAVNFGRNLRGRNAAFRCDPTAGFHCPKYFAGLKFEQ